MPDASAPKALSVQQASLGLLGLILFPDAGKAKPEGPEAAWLAAGAAALGPAKHAGAAFKGAMENAASGAGAGEAALVRTALGLGLTQAETAALAIALAVETEAIAGRAVAYLQAPMGGARPSLGLLASVLAPLDPDPGLLLRLASGRGVQSGLLRIAGDGPMPERALWLPDGLAAALGGAGFHWPGLQLLTDGPDADWPASLSHALDPVAAGLHAARADARHQLLTIRSTAPYDRAQILARLGQAMDLQPAIIDLDQTEPQGLGPLCHIAGLLPAFTANPGPGGYLPVPPLPGYDGPVIAFLGPEGQIGAPGLASVDWSLPVPDAGERTKLWRSHFTDKGLAEHLGTDHPQSAGRIRELALATQAQANLAGRNAPDRDALRDALWSSEGEGLGALAQPVRDEIPDAAMVAGPALRAELDLLNARCRRRERLAQGLGPAMQARYKIGVRALMTGPSGTGKTLAASWLAGRLNLALYRVDLAAVSSKYIGETEKNLAALLARAEEQEVVLLFDEADSLFGKRTDISDSNDRFANAQTNYLLQRIETYTGIVILTSNAKNRFDEAFNRRIDMIIEFHQPQPTERLALWAAHLGDAHAVGAADMNRLSAMAELAGGHIRNVVLMASVLAQEAGAQGIAYTHLANALKAEYRKLGWTPPAELLTSVEGR